MSEDAIAAAPDAPVTYYLLNSMPVLVLPVTSKEEALKLEGEGKGQIITKLEDLGTIPTSALIKIYNACPEVKHVTKFQDRSTALNRVWAAITKYPGGYAQDTKTKEITVMPTKKKTPKAAKTAKTPKAAKAKGEGAQRPGRAYKFGEKKLIKVSSENPRQEGSHGHRTWSLLRSGMTMAQAVKAGCRTNDLRHEVKLGRIKLD
jgi:hypothetical protein